MEPKSPDDGMTKFKNLPFSALVKEDRDLAAVRSDYASKACTRAKNGSGLGISFRNGRWDVQRCIGAGRARRIC